jgi:hypothetical protein
LQYASVLFSGDDYYDADQAHSGRCQFLFGLQYAEGSFDLGDEGFEIDGDDDDAVDFTGDPLTSTSYYNVTMIGNGSDRGVLAKERVEGSFTNCIFGNFQAGVDLDDDRTTDAEENFATLETLTFQNCSFVDCPALLTVGGAAPAPSVLAAFQGAGNVDAPGLIDTQFDIDTLSGTATQIALNFVPAAGTAQSDVDAPIDGFYTSAQYRGAFAPGTQKSWLEGWTAVDVFDLDNSLVSCPTDINGDGQTDVGDLNEFLGEFGNSCAIE